MSIDAVKPANVPIPTPNTSSDTTLSEDNKTAYELAKEAYKVKADLASIALAQSEIAYYEDLLKKDDKTLMEMLQSEEPDAKELAVISQRVFETGARVQAMKANVAEAEAEVGRNPNPGSAGATQNASSASAPSESAKTPTVESDFRSRLKPILASIPAGGFGTPAGKTVFEFAKEFDPVEPNQSSINFAKLTNAENRESLQKAEALLSEMVQAGDFVQSEFVKLSGWVFELGSYIKGREASLEEAEFKMIGTATGTENTPPVATVSSARPLEDTADIKFLREQVKQHKLETEKAYAELQDLNQKFSDLRDGLHAVSVGEYKQGIFTYVDNRKSTSKETIELADIASYKAQEKYNQIKETLATWEAELARAVAANVSD